MQITTERIRELRDQRIRDRSALYAAPERVQAVNEEQITILKELVQWREAYTTEPARDGLFPEAQHV